MSQTDYEELNSGSEFWRTQYGIGALVTSQFLVAILTTKVVTKVLTRAVEIEEDDTKRKETNEQRGVK